MKKKFRITGEYFMGKKNILKHLAVIMDGNRRWARRLFLPTFEGHRRGYEKLKKLADWCIDSGIEVLTVFAFSTENWMRRKEEVGYLMDLIRKMLRDDMEELHEKGIRIKIVGQKDRLPSDIQRLIEKIEKKTEKNRGLLLQVAISYGGRAEIVYALQKIVQKVLGKELEYNDITEEVIEKNLWTAGTKDPDLIIRTGGEYRLSGFLTWQGVYSELYFAKVPWPAFSKRDFQNAIDSYYRRKRNFGK